mmetsp:Transcript_63481/g.168199  ORF Transcript_63481/g.168199 Transcript_63481/m.168199 type:complete len:126 (+) Transcript_63481:691-1068(+)
MELLLLSHELHLDHRLVTRTGKHLEGPQFHICLHDRVSKLSADEPLGVKHGVLWIPRCLVFGSVSNQTLAVREGDITWSRAISLVIRNNFNSVILPHADTRVGGAQINAYSCFLCHGELRTTLHK